MTETKRRRRLMSTGRVSHAATANLVLRVTADRVTSTAHSSWLQLTSTSVGKLTRKPCYRKDDRAMRPIYGCPEKFRESSQTPQTTFPEICKGLLFRSILRMCIQNLKFVALSVP